MDFETKFAVGASFVLIAGILVLLRVISCLPCLDYSASKTKTKNLAMPSGKHAMILLGSGGHTGEMIRILEKFSNNSLETMKRTYVVSSGDNTSLLRIRKFEDEKPGKVGYFVLPRARNVGESTAKAVVNTVKSFVHTAWMFKDSSLVPDILLVNGPGTAVPLAYLLFALKVFGVGRTKIVYVESLARVKELSVSGRLILPLADRFLVQWEALAKKYKRTECYGIVV